MPRSEPGLLVMCFYMVEAQGFEPWTLGLKVRCSNQLSYTSMSLPYVSTLTNLAVGIEPTSSCSTSDTATISVNVFAYGRGTENRTLINRLKAYYFSR